MFSPLAKGNGSWDGHFEDESTFDSLFPSIYQTSIHGDTKLPHTDTNEINKTQDQVLQLPKTYLTRKGAILLFAAQHGKQNEREKEKRNDENIKDDSLLQVEEQIPPDVKRKLFLEFLDVFLKDQTSNKQAISKPINPKQNNWISKQHEEDPTENVFKVLSHPKSINSFYNHHETLVKRQKARPKTVPGNVLPREPEQPKAHPRITSGKPRPPIRALGKLPSKNTRSDLDKEKTTNLLQLPSPENHQTLVTRQLTTPNCSITNEMVQDDRISIPNSEYHFERSERVSRAASSMSRYSTWWAMDDVSLSYYDNEVQDDDDEYPECTECLSEQRSEIGRMPTSDTEPDKSGPSKRAISSSEDKVNDAFTVEEGNKKQYKSQKMKLIKELNASSIKSKSDFSEIDSQTFGEDKLCSEKPSKSRVKSAPVLAIKEVKYSPRCPRKAYSTGRDRLYTPVLLHSEYKTVSSTALQENYSVRIPSATSYYDNDNDEDTITISKDISEQPTLAERSTDCGVLKETGDTSSFPGLLGLRYAVKPSSNGNEDDGDIITTNQGLAAIVATSSPELSFASRGGEGSGDEVETVEPNTTKDAKQELKNAKQDMKPGKQNTKLVKQDMKLVEQDTKPAKQDTKPAKQDTKTAKEDMKQEPKCAKQDNILNSDLIELQISEIPTATATINSREYQTLENEVNQDEVLSETENTTSNTTEPQDTELGKEGQRENISSVTSKVLTSAVNIDSGDDKELDVKTLQRDEEEGLVKETNFEEKLSDGSDDDDSVASFAKDEYIETVALNTEDLFDTNFQKDALHESSQIDGVKTEELPKTNPDIDNLPEKSLHSNVVEVQKLSGTILNTVDAVIPEIYVREVQLISETDKIIENTGTWDSSFNFEKPMNGHDINVQAVDRLTTGLRDILQPVNHKEVKESVLGVNMTSKEELLDSVPKKRKGSSDIQQEVILNERISEPKSNDNSRNKSTLDENSKTGEEGKKAKVKPEKTKGDKLDIQGVGKADSKINEGKDKMEIQVQNKVDLSDLVAKKGNNKTTKKPTLRKKAKSPKTSRKTIPAPDQTPEPESSLNVIPAVDENLLKMIENPDGGLALSEETLNQFAPVEDFQDPDVLTVLDDKSIKTTDAFSPSKVKKGGKKAGITRKKKSKVVEGKVVESNVGETQKDAGEERNTRMAEEKAKQDEEMTLLKEREEEQRRLMEEAKEKQRTLDEERDKRLAQETEARRQEEDAEQALKEAKKKAKEEREKRREEEAERRRMEVQRKREEKRKRELEIQKREAELEKQRVDREQRMAELQAQKERELELERIAEEQRQDEERRRLLQLEEEKRQEETRIREAEEAVQRMAREREYREQMRKIAEAQQAKLEKQEMERRAQEEAKRAAIEDERRRLEHKAQMRENAELERVRELRQKEAIARIRGAHEASKRRAWALRRRAQNTERMANLRFTRQSQKLTEAFTFSYHVHVPREVWELPYDWNSKKKRGSFRPAKKKQNGGKKT